ncbi:hypothetical protein MNBD_ALPHA06-2086 [hydrothermal vent metagenome]|uniref:Polyhydroxyalkanoate granule-associated protein PhaI n=1 Tax=hydrothermal vent metagenome TaxID=652676 RepID=A0A3B0RMU7_9ZZZZ
MTNKAKKTVEQSSDLARKIWLAGVGAYGRAYTGTRDGLEQASSMTSDVFDELVERGEKIEDDVRSSISGNDRISKVVEAAGKFGAQRRARFSERVGAVRKGLGLNRGVFTMDDKLEALSDQINALTKDVAAIKKAVAKPVAKKATAKKTTAKKPATKKAAPKTAK